MIHKSEINSKTLRLQISATCDSNDKHVLKKLLREALSNPINHICLDFTNVKCVSSAAISILFHELRKYYPEDVKISVDSPPEHIKELLELTRLNSQLSVH